MDSSGLRRRWATTTDGTPATARALAYMSFLQFLFILSGVAASLALALATLQGVQGTSANVSWWPL